MQLDTSDYAAMQAELAHLRERLAESEAVLAALSAGEVDALMVGAPGQRRVFAIEGAETPYRYFVEAMAEGAATVDAAGRILYANEALALLLERPLRNLIGSLVTDLVNGEDRDRMDRLLAEVKNGSVHEEFDLGVQEGVHITAQVIGAPIPGGLRPGQVALVVQDITARTRSEAQVRALNETLEQQVAERTSDLQQSNQALEAFAYSVSHDLRAPLRSIDGFSQMLLDGYGDKLDAKGQDSLRRVRAASQRMSELIDAMLTLSHASGGDLALGPVDLSAIALEVVAELRYSTPLDAVSVAIAPGLDVHSDKRLLRDVLENLLSNAWKYAGKVAAPHIEFGAETAGAELVCHVRDNGAGFDMAQVDKLFVPFQRLHSAAEFPGNGIGMATVKRIISRLGGRVWAEGAVGVGATFYFALPLTATAHALRVAESALKPSAASDGTRPGG